ncbi:MAG: hypothetical protein H0X25_16355 [Acidobacteriales bacterium]|nr:hypothetical protein [Terriglobales bacterium]
MKEVNEHKPGNPDRACRTNDHAKPELTLEDLASIAPPQNQASAENAKQPERLHPNFVAARAKTQFKPGQSGNPGGRRKPIMRDMLLELGFSEHARDPQGRTYLELASVAVFLTAIKGSVSAYRELCDRIDGKCSPLQASSDSADRLDELVKALQTPQEEEDKKQCAKCRRCRDEEDESQ